MSGLPFIFIVLKLGVKRHGEAEAVREALPRATDCIKQKKTFKENKWPNGWTKQ